MPAREDWHPRLTSFARLGFSEAADRHLDDRLPSLAKRSIETEKERLKPLRKYFGEMPLARISPDRVRAYIAERKKAGVANKTVNLEIGVIRGILKRAKRWHLLSDEIKALPVQHQGRSGPSALTRNEVCKTPHKNSDWRMPARP